MSSRLLTYACCVTTVVLLAPPASVAVMVQKPTVVDAVYVTVA